MATGLILTITIFALLRNGDAWLGLTYLLILLIPITGLSTLKLKNTNREKTREASAKWRNFLFSLQGAAIAFWMFDIMTTFYAINITGLAVELNPLGWPLGILGAFSYYIPSLIFSYLLLFRMKEKISLYSAMMLTILTLSMASMNLLAGIQNFKVFVDTASLAIGFRDTMMPLLVALNFIVPFAIRRMSIEPKAVLQKNLR